MQQCLVQVHWDGKQSKNIVGIKNDSYGAGVLHLSPIVFFGVILLWFIRREVLNLQSEKSQ